MCSIAIRVARRHGRWLGASAAFAGKSFLWAVAALGDEGPDYLLNLYIDGARISWPNRRVRWLRQEQRPFAILAPYFAAKSRATRHHANGKLAQIPFNTGLRYRQWRFTGMAAKAASGNLSCRRSPRPPSRCADDNPARRNALVRAARRYRQQRHNRKPASIVGAVLA